MISSKLTELDSLQDVVGLGSVIPSSQTREASRVGNGLDTTRSYPWLGCRCCALDKLNGPCESAGKRDANVLNGDGPLVLFVWLLATGGPDPTRMESESFPHFETVS